MNRIYLDWNATAPLLPEVKAAMIAALDDAPGNASSIHREGQRARSVIERTRRAIARAINAPPQAVVLCGGATEGNNQILRTHAAFAGQKLGKKPLIVCSSVEHPSVIEVVEVLGEQGVQVSLLGVDRLGRIDLEEIRAQLEAGATLVSVMWANNECGNIYPVADIASLCREYGALFHTDATQALGRIEVDFDACGADYMTLSLHKMGGPKGVGAIVVREGIVLEAMLAGGHQERGRRPGTENVPAVAGAGAAALQVVDKLGVWHEALAERRERLLGALTKGLGESFKLRQDPENHLLNTINVAFDKVGGEDLLLALDLAGVSASSGSACTAGSLEPSHVILAMGYEAEDAKRSIRLSFGPLTPLSSIDEAASRVIDAVTRQRALAL
jgi:cysteine desulfurase